MPRLAPWLKDQRPALLISTHAPYLPEPERRERMAALAETLSFYRTWQAKGEPIDPESLSQTDALTGFHSYLLTA